MTPPKDKTTLSYAWFLLGSKPVICKWSPVMQSWLHETQEIRQDGTVISTSAGITPGENCVFIAEITPPSNLRELEIRLFVQEEDNKSSQWKEDETAQFNKVVRWFARKEYPDLTWTTAVRTAFHIVKDIVQNSQDSRLNRLWDTSNWDKDTKKNVK